MKAIKDAIDHICEVSGTTKFEIKKGVIFTDRGDFRISSFSSLRVDDEFDSNQKAAWWMGSMLAASASASLFPPLLVLTGPLMGVCAVELLAVKLVALVATIDGKDTIIFARSGPKFKYDAMAKEVERVAKRVRRFM